ncbi:hypothetical protein THAOC_05047, partial [Thalassiosira oceanica]
LAADHRRGHGPGKVLVDLPRDRYPPLRIPALAPEQHWGGKKWEKRSNEKSGERKGQTIRNETVRERKTARPVLLTRHVYRLEAPDVLAVHGRDPVAESYLAPQGGLVLDVAHVRGASPRGGVDDDAQLAWIDFRRKREGSFVG